MAIDWSLARQPNVLAMALDGYEQGKQMRREEASRNALGALVQNPNDQAAFGTLAQNAPEYAMQFRGQQQQVQLGQAKQHGEQMQQLGRLLNHATDETTYQQSLAAAKQIGLDVSTAPPQFDPNWVGQQRLVLQAFEKDGGAQISGLARELSDAGYKPGTPEFQQAMATALRGKYAPQYTDQQGNVRMGQLPPLPGIGQAPRAPQAAQIIPTRPQGMSDDDLFRQAQEAVANGADRNAVFEQLQAWGVQPKYKVAQ